MSLKTKFIHWKIKWFGDKELEKNGYKILPCVRCDQLFKSYEHYSGYDTLCKNCER